MKVNGKWQMGKWQMAAKWQMGKSQMANPAPGSGRRGCAGARGSDLRFDHLRFAISRRRGFSLIEMMVALAITASLLSASLAALDTSFKSYQMTSQSSSTHVVTRIVMHRMLSMIRVGKEFGPFPQDVFDPTLNPMVLDGPFVSPTQGFQIEFVSHEDPVSGDREVTRLEARQAADGTLDLMLIIRVFHGSGGVTAPDPIPILQNLRSATVTLEYDVGPKLRKASIDLTVAPNDIGDEIDTGLTAPVIRLVASASPRNLE